MLCLHNAYLVVASAAILTLVNSTIIAVVELGKGNVVHRSAYSSTSTSADGIYSFWKTMHAFNDKGIFHRNSPSLQFPNMGVVPDLINFADGGLVIGLAQNFVDMAPMPTISNFLKENGAVGHLHVDGRNVETIMKNINSQIVDSASFEKSIVQKLNSLFLNGTNKLESTLVKLDDNVSATIVDSAFAKVLQTIKKNISSTGKTIVIYIVVDEKFESHNHDFMSRGLSEDNNGQDENEEEEDRNEEDAEDRNEEEEDRNEEDAEDRNEEDAEDRNEDENERDEERNQQNYYNEGNLQGQNKYGYINAYGEWTSTYKSMSHIQYSNVVLWTSIILIVAVIISTGMMIYMPLMPDTLLFGESAKMIME